MPAAIAVPAIASVIAGGAAAGATVYGSRQASRGARRAQDIQSRADAAAMEEARQQREEDRRRWEAEQEMQRQQWAAQEEERAYHRRLAEEREARAAPYRAASAAALGNLGRMLGIDLSQTPLNQSLTAPRSLPPAGGVPTSQVPPRGTPGPVVLDMPLRQGPPPLMRDGGWGPRPPVNPGEWRRDAPQVISSAMGPEPLAGSLGDLTGLKRRTQVRY